MIKMKGIWFALLMCFVCLAAFPFAPSGITKHIDRPPCPTLSITCPTFPVSGASPTTFLLDVSGARRNGLKEEIVEKFKGVESKYEVSYKWEVSGGSIVKGQGTRTIQAEPTATNQNETVDLVATVEICGLDPACSRSTSCSLKIRPGCEAPQKFDDYGDLSFEEEKKRLHNFAMYLLGGGPESVGYILAYTGQNSCFWEGELRAERAKNYLVETYRLESDRIVAFDSGYRKTLTIDLFLSSRAGCGPFPTPTLRGSRAELVGSCFEKYEKRNEAIRP